MRYDLRSVKKVQIKKIFLILILVFFIIAITILIIDGTFLSKKYSKIWSKDYLDSLDNIQHKLIAGGITAASSHNMQPWLVKIVNERQIELYLDMTKALKVVDHDNTQMLMSQGTFIKAYKNYANAYGYDVVINYREPDFTSEQPLIATIDIIKNVTEGKADAISSSSWMVFENEDAKKSKDTLMAEILKNYDGFDYELISESELKDFQGFLLEGMIIESTNQNAVEEMIEVFRFTEWEKNKYKYGLTMNAPGAFKPVIQSISKLFASNWKEFGDQGIKIFEKRLKKEHTYILIKSEQLTYKEYVLAGQIYQEMVGKFNQYSVRPAVQVLEKYDEMKDINKVFQEKYGESNEVLLIIGIQNKLTDQSVKTPRHLVGDILID